jgi:hypothetical protein
VANVISHRSWGTGSIPRPKVTFLFCCQNL